MEKYRVDICPNPSCSDRLPVVGLSCMKLAGSIWHRTFCSQCVIMADMADDGTWSERSRVYFKIYLLSGIRCGFYVVCEVSFWNNSFMFALPLLFLIRSLSDRLWCLTCVKWNRGWMKAGKRASEETDSERRRRPRALHRRFAVKDKVISTSPLWGFQPTLLRASPTELVSLFLKTKTPAPALSSSLQTNGTKCLKLSISPELGGDAMGTPWGSSSRYRRTISFSTAPSPQVRVSDSGSLRNETVVSSLQHIGRQTLEPNSGWCDRFHTSRLRLLVCAEEWGMNHWYRLEGSHVEPQTQQPWLEMDSSLSLHLASNFCNGKLKRNLCCITILYTKCYF